MRRSGFPVIVLAAALLLAAGCATGYREALRKGLASDNPRAQAEAIARAANRGDCSVVPDLIDRLESDDPGVRFMAIAGLRRLTGQDFGCLRACTDRERAEVAERYRQWWNDEGAAACGQSPVDWEARRQAAEDPTVEQSEEG